MAKVPLGPSHFSSTASSSAELMEDINIIATVANVI
jgi:hypothetical protein